MLNVASHRIITGHLLAWLVAMMLTLPVAPAWSADGVREHTLVIGKVSTNPKKHYRYLKPMADYVVHQMKDLGIDRSQVLMARNNRQMIRYLRQGKVDWVTETVFSALEFEREAGAEILLLKWKKGVATYHTVFITRHGSSIHSLQDLRDKTITLQDKGSTTGFFIPVALMLDAGLELVELQSPREKPPKGTVGYVFGKEEINMSTWVHKGIVDAAAFSDLDLEKDDHTPKSFRKNMVIFHRSREYPRALELVRKDLRPELKQRLKSVLLASHEDPEAAAALKAYQKTQRFSDIDESVKQGIDRARAILKTVDRELDL
ncbi:MAG: phosphate/phosphite/phosphonate ABC transporter substrate-binding protein [Gammaproteobacteria bacterium]